MKNDEEDKLISDIDHFKLYGNLIPAIEEFLKQGGTVERFLASCTPVAYARLASLVVHDKPDVALKAALALIERKDGKAVERKQVLFGDVKDLSMAQLDAEILRALKSDEKLRELAPALAPAPAQPAEAPKKPAKTKRTPKVIKHD